MLRTIGRICVRSCSRNSILFIFVSYNPYLYEVEIEFTEKAGVAVRLWACIQEVVVRILIGTPAVLTEVFCGFPESL
jgi:hypothetical protein